MTEQNPDMDKEALKSWYSKLLQEVAREMIKIGAVTGAAAEARPVWISPVIRWTRRLRGTGSVGTDRRKIH